MKGISEKQLEHLHDPPPFFGGGLVPSNPRQADDIEAGAYVSRRGTILRVTSNTIMGQGILLTFMGDVSRTMKFSFVLLALPKRI